MPPPGTFPDIACRLASSPQPAPGRAASGQALPQDEAGLTELDRSLLRSLHEMRRPVGLRVTFLNADLPALSTIDAPGEHAELVVGRAGLQPHLAAWDGQEFELTRACGPELEGIRRSDLRVSSPRRDVLVRLFARQVPNGPSVELGPFGEVTVDRDAVRGDGAAIALASGGGWRPAGGPDLVADIIAPAAPPAPEPHAPAEPEPREVRIELERLFAAAANEAAAAADAERLAGEMRRQQEADRHRIAELERIEREERQRATEEIERLRLAQRSRAQAIEQVEQYRPQPARPAVAEDADAEEDEPLPLYVLRLLWQFRPVLLALLLVGAGYVVWTSMATSGEPGRSARIGEHIRTDVWDYVVTLAERASPAGLAPNGLLVVRLTVTNQTDDVRPLTTSLFAIVDGSGQRYAAEPGSSPLYDAARGGTLAWAERYPPGVPVRTTVLFRVPADAPRPRLVINEPEPIFVSLER